MEFKLFANLVDVAGDRRISVDAQDAVTLEEALDALFETVPELRDEVLDSDGVPNEHINILINGSNIAHEDVGLDRQVDADDEIAIFPPVSGGTGHDRPS